MIIRLTVHDNDFGNLIDAYFDDLIEWFWFGITINENNLDYPKEFRISMKMKRLLNSCEELTNEDMEFLIDRIKSTFSDFVRQKEPNSADYLISNLEVAIIHSLEDKDENGEVWYWLLHSGKYINQ